MENFVVGVLLEPRGIDFEALDGKKVSFFFFIVGPQSERSRHIQLLSTISKLLRQKHTLDRLRKTEEPAEVLSIIVENLQQESAPLQGRPGAQQCLFHVIVQREEHFDEILEIFSASAQGSVAVIEAKSAGAYTAPHSPLCGLLDRAAEPLWMLVAQPLQEIGLSLILGGVLGVLFSVPARKPAARRDVFPLSFAVVLISIGISSVLHLSLILTNLVIGLVVVNLQPGDLAAKIRDQLDARSRKSANTWAWASCRRPGWRSGWP